VRSIDVTSVLPNWSHLEIAMANGRRVVVAKFPSALASGRSLAERLAEFTRARLRDCSEGDYVRLMRLSRLTRLTNGCDRLAMRPPRRAVARWIGAAVTAAGVIAFVVFAVLRGSNVNGRGIVYLCGAVGLLVYAVAARLLRRSIVLDGVAKTIRVGGREVGAFHDVDHLALHVGKDGSHRMQLVLRDGRRFTMIEYGGYPPTLLEAARTIAEFGAFRMVDYYYDLPHAAERERDERSRRARS
jgi:hypothetical protein